MKTNRILAAVLSVLMLAALLGACGKGGSQPGDASSATSVLSSMEVGIGQTEFTVKVVHSDGSERTIAVSTSKENLGEALQTEGIVDGETGQYGLYVTFVDGETLKYEDDGMYWAFYVGDAYSSVGVSQVLVEDGAEYTFKAEKDEQ